MQKKISYGRKVNTIRNIAMGGVYRVVGILFPFIIRTCIINFLGTEYLGLNSLFSSILNVLNLTEFGFANAITYKMYKPAAENDISTLSELLSIYKLLYRSIAIIILIVGLTLTPFLPKLINGSYPGTINLYLVYLIYLANSVLSYLLFAYRGALFSAYQRLDIQSMISTAVLFSLNLVQVLILIFFKNYYAYIIMMPVFTIINNLLIFVATKRQYPNVESNKKIDKDILISIIKKSGAMFGHKLNYVIVSSADNIVISTYLGLTILAKYGNYFTILSAVVGVIDTITQAILPSVGNLLVERNNTKNNQMFDLFSFVQHWFVGWCCVCLVCLYQPFMTVWMGEKMLLDMAIVVLLAVYLYSYKSRSIVLMFKDAAGMWNEDLMKPYVSALCNIVLNIMLVKVIGLYGVILSTIISFSLISFPWESAVLIRKLLRRPLKSYVITVCKYAIHFVVIGFITYIICCLLPYDGMKAIVVRGVVCVLFPNSIYIIANWGNCEMRRIRLFIKRL